MKKSFKEFVLEAIDFAFRVLIILSLIILLSTIIIGIILFLYNQIILKIFCMAC